MSSICSIIDRLFWGTTTTEAAQIISTSVTLTDAQIKALPSANITLVSAPGASKRLEPIAFSAYLDRAAGAYTGMNASYCDLAVWWDSASGSQASSVLFDDASQVYGDGVTPVTALTDFLSALTSPTIWRPQSFCYYDSFNASSGLLGYSFGAGGGSFTNKALVLTLNNNGSGNLGGGNAANSMVFRTLYWIANVP